MATAIEGVYKKGVIKPLRNIKLKDNTKVVITIKDKKKDDRSILKYAGAWKDYKTFDDRTLDDVKEDIFKDRKFSARKEVKF